MNKLSTAALEKTVMLSSSSVELLYNGEPGILKLQHTFLRLQSSNDTVCLDIPKCNISDDYLFIIGVMSDDFREGGWWGGWLTQSFQTVKDKVR